MKEYNPYATGFYINKNETSKFDPNYPGFNDERVGFLLPFLTGAILTAPLWVNRYPAYQPYPYPYPMPYPVPYPYQPYPYYPTYQRRYYRY